MKYNFSEEKKDKMQKKRSKTDIKIFLKKEKLLEYMKKYYSTHKK